jgi:hypothetical protein
MEATGRSFVEISRLADDLNRVLDDHPRLSTNGMGLPSAYGATVQLNLGAARHVHAAQGRRPAIRVIRENPGPISWQFEGSEEVVREGCQMSGSRWRHSHR